MKTKTMAEKQEIINQFTQLINSGTPTQEALKKLKVALPDVYRYRSELKRQAIKVVSYTAKNPKKPRAKNKAIEKQFVGRMILIRGTPEEIASILRGVA